MIPGWELPGIMSVGGVQALLKGGDVVAGSRVAIGGTGPFLLPVAAALADRGASVVGVFEANSPMRWVPHMAAIARNATKLAEGLGYARTLLRQRVRLHARTMIVAAQGADRIDGMFAAGPIEHST